MTVTLQDIANAAGVNISTASRALSGSQSISLKTKAKIEKIAADLDYQPNNYARVLAGKKSNICGIIVPEINSGYFAKLVGSVEEKLRERGYSLIIANSQFSEKNEAEAIDSFINNNVAGIFLASSIYVDNQKRLQLVNENHQVAVVLLEALAHHSEYNYVMIEDTYGMQKSIEYLLSKGHKKIGFISDYILDLIRKPMYFEALRLNGLLKKDHPLLSHRTKRYEEAGYEIMNQFLDMDEPPTGYLAGYDNVAIGAIRAAEERGYKIPEEIAIIGNDDISASSYLQKKLTTLSPPVDRMGELGVRLMLDMIENNEYDTLHQIKLKPNLIIRETA